MRSGSFASHTSSLAAGHIQANLIILPKTVASDFRDLCARNPVPCPLIAQSSEPGNPHLFDNPLAFSHGNDIDVRTDLPKYNVYHTGKLVTSKTDIRDEWTDDHVAFLIGCSFSFDAALTKAGLQPRHLEEGCNVSMYRTKRKVMSERVSCSSQLKMHART